MLLVGFAHAPPVTACDNTASTTIAADDTAIVPAQASADASSTLTTAKTNGETARSWDNPYNKCDVQIDEETGQTAIHGMIHTYTANAKNKAQATVDGTQVGMVLLSNGENVQDWRVAMVLNSDEGNRIQGYPLKFSNHSFFILSV
ncbi:hypothetical protein ACFL04_02765 [Patescibacteria group bacterium]